MKKETGVLLFGGTFDPIHHGHLIVSRAAAEHLGVEKVVLIPSAAPPHKLEIRVSAAQDRLHMARLAVEGDDLFAVSDCELKREGPSYSMETIRHFRRRYGEETELYWLIGADSLPDLPNWYAIGQLATECTIVTAARPGWESNDLSGLEAVLEEERIGRIRQHILGTPQIDISATEIRKRVHQGQSIRFLVPAPVADYIDEHRIYPRE